MVEKSPDGRTPSLNSKRESREREEARRLHAKLAEAMSTIYELYHMLGYPGKERCHERTLEDWVNKCGSNCTWIQFLKYKLAALFSHYTDQPIPKKPFKAEDKAHTLLGGKAGIWLKNQMKFDKTDPMRRLTILTSILQAKKGLPRPEQEDLEKAVKKTVDKLTSPPPLPTDRQNLLKWSDVHEQSPDFVLSDDAIKRQLERTVKELFGGHRYTLQDRQRLFFPSTRANFLNTRAEGGAVATILSSGVLGGLREPGGPLKLEEAKDAEEGIRGEKRFELNTTRLEVAFSVMWERMLNEAKTEPPMVEPVPLAEPLKVRVISKGPPMTYTVLRPLWKFCHNILRQHPTFKLIGQPHNELAILNGLGRRLRPNEWFLSGDYEAATDNLKPWVSRTIAKAICHEIGIGGTVEEELFLRALTDHLFYDPELEVIKEQLSGQLMGSIVSFPVLCVANAALCRWAWELAYNQTKLLRDIPLLINGDDIAARGVGQREDAGSFYQLWRQITAAAGLVESIGKTYYSREFVQINSTNYMFAPDSDHTVSDGNPTDPIERQCPFIEVRYINLGLMYGLKRSGEGAGMGDQADARTTLSARAKELLRYTPTHLQERVYHTFINHHRDLMTKTRLPWFIPEWLGGLGLPARFGYKPSNKDLRLAHLILMNWKETRPINLTRSEGRWMTRKRAEGRLPAPVPTLDEDGELGYERALQMFVINTLFDSDLTITQLLQEMDGNDKVAKAINHNAKMWSPKGKNLPSPLDPFQLEFHQPRLGLNITIETRHKEGEVQNRDNPWRERFDRMEDYLDLWDDVERSPALMPIAPGHTYRIRQPTTTPISVSLD
jgi:hypothetical protein